MLTRELLPLRRRNGSLKLSFLTPDGPALALCRAMLAVFQDGARSSVTREELEERLEPLLKSSPALAKIAAGLAKLLTDHAGFAIRNAPENCSELRTELLERAGRLLAEPPADYEVYRKMVLREVPGELDFYGDLPDYESLIEVPAWTAEELLNRYNIALVQGLLLYAGSLRLTLEAATPMELRKFMRRLKFFRLLAEVRKVSGSRIDLAVSGPGALFGENRKYGLQLAAFFPAVLLMKQWHLRAEITLRDGPPEILSLTAAKCPCRSYFRRWSTFVPEEVALFLRSFQENVASWRCDPDAPLPRVAGEGTIFPDFSFVAADDPARIVHVEIFHRWHAAPLEKRLAFLAERPETPLLLGIDRFLLGKNGEEAFLAKYPGLEKHLFFFSNYPGVERVKRMLDRF